MIACLDRDSKELDTVSTQGPLRDDKVSSLLAIFVAVLTYVNSYKTWCCGTLTNMLDLFQKNQEGGTKSNDIVVPCLNLAVLIQGHENLAELVFLMFHDTGHAKNIIQR